MNKIKMLSLLAAAAMMTGSVAMAETYSATGNGYHGEMTVDVTIENGTITDVALGDNHETNVVIDRAFPVIREPFLKRIRRMWTACLPRPSLLTRSRLPWLMR